MKTVVGYGLAGWLLLGGLIMQPLAAEEAKFEAVVDPQAAGPDYALQGEYKGEITLDEGRTVFGAQIIALGDGQFQLTGYRGGLPGDGWSKGAERVEHRGQRVDGAAEFKVESATLRAKDGVLRVVADGAEIGRLEKVERVSPTLEMAPPKDAIVLFDGTSVDAWENGKLVEGHLLGATGCSTRRKFGDHHLHLEFRTPFMPKATGQARGNSGLYVQSRYECQVLDSFGLVGENNECGGFYLIAAPAVNMCYPPLRWQTYDLDFTAARYDAAGKKTKNARVTVKHNGVVIHNDLELPKDTPGRNAEGPEPDAIFLQDHGNPVAYRNIWVVEKH